MALVRTKTVKETKKLAYLSNIYQKIGGKNEVKRGKKRKKSDLSKIKADNITISKQEIIQSFLYVSFIMAFAALGYILAKLIQ